MWSELTSLQNTIAGKRWGGNPLGSFLGFHKIILYAKIVVFKLILMYI